jgi:hypothetical protein
MNFVGFLTAGLTNVVIADRLGFGIVGCLIMHTRIIPLTTAGRAVRGVHAGVRLHSDLLAAALPLVPHCLYLQRLRSRTPSKSLKLVS